MNVQSIAPPANFSEVLTEQTQPVQEPSFEDLPADVAITILSSLTNPCSVSLVSCKWRKLAIEAVKRQIFEKYQVDVRALSNTCGMAVDARCIAILEKFGFPCAALASLDREAVRRELSMILDGQLDLLQDPFAFNRKLVIQTAKNTKKIVYFLFSFYGSSLLKENKSYGFREFVADLRYRGEGREISPVCEEYLKKNRWPPSLLNLLGESFRRSGRKKFIKLYVSEPTEGSDSVDLKNMTLPPVDFFKALEPAELELYLSNVSLIPSGIGPLIEIKKLLVSDSSIASLTDALKGMGIRILRLSELPNLTSISPAITGLSELFRVDIYKCPQLSLENIEWPRMMCAAIREDDLRVVFARRPEEDSIAGICKFLEAPRQEFDYYINLMMQAYKTGTSLRDMDIDFSRLRIGDWGFG